MAGSVGIKAQMQWDENSLNRFKQEFENLKKTLNKDSKINIDLSEQDEKINKLKSELEGLYKQREKIKLNIDTKPAETKLAEFQGSYEKIVKDLLGTKNNFKISPTFDSKGELKSFQVQLEQSKGIIDKINYSLKTVSNEIGVPVKELNNFEIKSISTQNATERLIQQQEKALQQEIDYGNKLIQQQEKEQVNNEKIAQQEKEQADLAEIKWEREQKYLNQLKQSSNLNIATKASNLSDEISATLPSDKVTQARLKVEYAELTAEAKKFTQEVDKDIARVQKLGTSLGKINTEDVFNKSASELKQYASSLNGVNGTITSVKKNTDALGNETITLTSRIKNADNSFTQETYIIDKATKSLYKNGEAVKTASESNISFGQHVKGAFQSIASFSGVAGAFYGTVNAIKSGISNVVNMETQLTNLNKVVDMSKSQLQDMKQSAFDMGKAMGQSSTDIMEAFSTIGSYKKNLSDIKQIAQTSIEAANVTSMDSATAAKMIDTAMNSFGISANKSIKILDSWNQLSNNFRKIYAEVKSFLIDLEAL